ncbi:MAG: hypothetical protein JWN70_1014 [Planctomycetaceae bacterium]|nr:hypothetical protein [Planctomycetaceae bacterium]
MDDLKQFDNVPSVDTWRMSGIKAERGKRITWPQNEAWLQERIARGDRFGFATDTATLPPRVGVYIDGVPNGYLTRREHDMLQKLQIVVERFW